MTYNPDWGEEETELDTGETGINTPDDDCSVALGADTYAYDAEIHYYEGPETPVDDHHPEIFHCPRLPMIDARQVFVMDSCIFARECRFACRSPLLPSFTDAGFPRRKRSIWKPPEK